LLTQPLVRQILRALQGHEAGLKLEGIAEAVGEAGSAGLRRIGKMVAQLADVSLVVRRAGVYAVNDSFWNDFESCIHGLWPLPLDDAPQAVQEYTSGGLLVRFPENVEQQWQLVQVVSTRLNLSPGGMSEAEVNDELSRFTTEPATLRRLLIDFRSLDRNSDGSSYFRVVDYR